VPSQAAHNRGSGSGCRSAPSGNVRLLGRRCLILASHRVGPRSQRATPSSAFWCRWVAPGRAGPTPVIQVAAPVTPCRHDAGPTVLHEHRKRRARASAATLGGDVVGTHQIPVPLEPAPAAAEPAPSWFGDSPTAGRTGGGAAPLVHQPYHDTGVFGLVAQCQQQVGAVPLPQPQVVGPTGVPVGDASRVTYQQEADTLLNGDGDDLLSGLMLGLVDAAAMTGLHPALSGTMPPPAARAPLPRFGGPAGRLGLLIAQVQIVLGADRPPRDQ
jgi:hypothetical protein